MYLNDSAFRFFRSPLTYVLAIGVGLLSGCGGNADAPEIAPVQGNVTFAGKSVASGQIHFADDEQGRIYTATISSGQYAMKSQHGSGIPFGNYKIQITPPPANDPSAPPSDDPAAGGEAPDVPDIPERYRSYATSGLTADVKAGTEKLDFEMKK